MSCGNGNFSPEIFGHKDGDMVIYPRMGELGIISPANGIKRWIYPTSWDFLTFLDLWSNRFHWEVRLGQKQTSLKLQKIVCFLQSTQGAHNSIKTPKLSLENSRKKSCTLHFSMATGWTHRQEGLPRSKSSANAPVWLRIRGLRRGNMHKVGKYEEFQQPQLPSWNTWFVSFCMMARR